MSVSLPVGTKQPIETPLRPDINHAICQDGRDLSRRQHGEFGLLAGQQDPLAFFIGETLIRVAMGVLATLHTIDGTTEMVAPALQRGEPDVKEDRQLRAMGALSNSFTKGL